jgi:hypothetical protein
MLTLPSFDLDDQYLRNLGLLDTTRRKAMERFYKNLRDSDTNLAVDIAEWRQAAGMMADTCEKITELAQRVRKFSFKINNLQKILFETYGNHVRDERSRKIRYYLQKHKYNYNGGPSTVFAQTWLSYTYGWKPLMGTIFGLAEFIRNKARYMRVKGSFLAGRDKITLGTAGLGIPYYTETCDRVIANVVCDLRVDSPILNDVSRLTSLNPAAIGWELVPYSFVVDWFFNIGGYLEELEQSMGSGVGLKFVRGYTSHVHVTTVKHTIPPYSGKSGNPRNSVPYTMTHTERYVLKDRVKLTSLPYPYFPKFEVDLGVSRILSAASLLQQVFFNWGNSSQRSRHQDRKKIRFGAKFH